MNPPGGFPPTHHSAILTLRVGNDADRRRALDTISEVYWKPVYRYIRLQWNRGREEAEDLTQGFFLTLIEKEFLATYDPARARFRTFLRTCLDRFVMNADRAAGRLKRGGGEEIVPLDSSLAETDLRAAHTGDSPDRLFEREFVTSLLSGAVSRLRDECDTHDRSLCFRLFERYDLSAAASGAQPTYADLASEFGLTVETVTNYLAAARRDFRRIVLDQLRAMTASESEYQEEVRIVLGVGGA